MFLFDTDHIVIIQQRTEPEFNRLSVRMSARHAEDFFIPIVSFDELVRGWSAYIKRARKAAGLVTGYLRLEKILADFAQARIASFDEAAAAHFANR
ncbi:MAG TPA: hypothetical protein VJ783_25095 [Pirellulales bacterium]|nr:hypothetical protein [Pirellulales bacterium]